MYRARFNYCVVGLQHDTGIQESKRLLGNHRIHILFMYSYKGVFVHELLPRRNGLSYIFPAVILQQGTHSSR